MQLECDPLGVIAYCDALGWIEVCSTLGSLVASRSNEIDSMLIILIAKENGWILYIVLWMLTKWF